MSIEQALSDLTAALEANTAACLATLTGASTSRRARPPRADATATPALEVASPAPVVALSEPSAPVVAEPVASPAPTTDPFAAIPAAPTVTLDQVREKAVALSKATSQDNAVAVMKAATGASSFGELKAEQYAVAYAAFVKGVPVADPFAVGAAPVTPSASPAAPAVAVSVQTDAPSLDDVKAALRAAQKRTGRGKVESIVVAHGGKAVNPADGTVGVSIKALPISAYAAVIAAVNALPDTKGG